MNTSRIRDILFCMMLLAIIVTACKSRQKIVYSTTPVEDKEYNELFKDVLSAAASYNTFSSRLNMTVTTGTRSISSRASLRMIKDEAIQISIQPLFGVEFFRFFIDNDTIVVLDRMNKRYVQESILSVKEQYPVGFDFYTLQSILTNSLFVSGEKEVFDTDYKRFNFTRTSDRNYYMISKDPESQIEYSFTVNGEDRITFTHLMHHENKQSLQWTYSNFSNIDNFGLFPHRMTSTLSTKSQRLDANLQFSDITIDQPISLNISIPDDYNRVELSDILKIITQSS